MKNIVASVSYAVALITLIDLISYKVTNHNNPRRVSLRIITQISNTGTKPSTLWHRISNILASKTSMVYNYKIMVLKTSKIDPKITKNNRNKKPLTRTSVQAYHSIKSIGNRTMKLNM